MADGAHVPCSSGWPGSVRFPGFGFPFHEEAVVRRGHPGVGLAAGKHVPGPNPKGSVNTVPSRFILLPALLPVPPFRRALRAEWRRSDQNAADCPRALVFE